MRVECLAQEHNMHNVLIMSARSGVELTNQKATAQFRLKAAILHSSLLVYTFSEFRKLWNQYAQFLVLYKVNHNKPSKFLLVCVRFRWLSWSSNTIYRLADGLGTSNFEWRWPYWYVLQGVWCRCCFFCELFFSCFWASSFQLRDIFYFIALYFLLLVNK